jgi:diamine N-acetyltransferase
MVAIELRDIVTDAERAAAIALRTAPGQERFVASVETSLAEALEYPEACARSWTVNHGDEVVGFVMLSDGIPEEVLADDPTLVGPYFLWRLLIDERHQREGYGSAALRALAAYVRGRPGGDALLTSAGQGDGSPQPFYERNGFVPTGEVHEGEVVLRLDLGPKDA